MAPSNASGQVTSGVDTVRARLLTSLHVGRLSPGDRVPSVRRLAGLTGLNRKTIHRAFTRLAEEGLLELRPGSGTFIRERGSAPATDGGTDELVAAVQRIRAVAASLKLERRVFAAFVSAAVGGALEGARVTVVECNLEQSEMISNDLVRSLGAAPRTVLLSQLEGNIEGLLRGSCAVVTTNCHLEEVVDRVRTAAVPVHAVSLDSRFPRTMIDLARRGRVVLVARDPAFGPVLFRLLRQMGCGGEALERIVLTHPSAAVETMRQAARGEHVYLSPLVPRRIHDLTPSHLRVVRDTWHVPGDALERLRANLALDYACRRSDATTHL